MRPDARWTVTSPGRADSLRRRFTCLAQRRQPRRPILNWADWALIAANQHRPHRSLHGAAPLKPLPEPIAPDPYPVRKQAHTGGLINEYSLVA
jgi:hypothetical protein